MKRLIVAMTLLCAPSSYSTDLIVFSYNRPMQLYAFLESLAHCATGLTSVSVLYRADDGQYERGYQEVQHTFPGVSWRRQGSHPSGDFKPITLDLMDKGASEYVVFGVDDIIFTHCFDFQICTDAMQRTDAYGFFLRVGKNVTCCQVGKCNIAHPPLHDEGNLICSWRLSEGQHVWGYPNTLDMTIYKKSDIRSCLYSMGYQNPNSFESVWCGQTAGIIHRKGLCFEHSVMVNIPTNKVQSFCTGWSLDSYSPKDLLDMFFQGKKIDIASLFLFKNNSAHINYEIRIVER